MKVGDLVGRSYTENYAPKGHRGRGIIVSLDDDPQYGECATVYWFFSGNINEFQIDHLKILSESP